MSPPLAPAVARLFTTLAELADAPVSDDLGAALRRLPDVGALPSPWDTWTLIGLARHQARQDWVLRVVRERLRGDSSAVDDYEGEVPGLSGWRYLFHGRGCCLTCEATGEAIDVDFVDDTAEHFDSYFYVGHLGSLREPDVPEARLHALCPELELVVLAIEDMQDAGALVRGGHRVYFRLSSALRGSIGAIDRVCRALADPARRCWIAACLGDWPWARELATDPALLAELDARAEQCLALRRERLDHGLAERAHHTSLLALRGLAALAVDDLDALLLAALASPPSGLVSLALELIEPRWRPDLHADAVLDRLQRVDPRGEIPQPHIFATCAALLLEHQCQVDAVLARLDDLDDRADARLLTLALAFRAPAALGLLRRALRSRVPMHRGEAAALLAAIDAPWTCRELRTVLAESDDLETTGECRAALRCSRDPAARAALDAWERLHPYTPATEPPFTYLDIQTAQADDDLAYRIEDQADLLARYRDRLADPDREQMS
ncbi:hypothetical protein OV203_32815 [Nannocystis sp. ILAH1]|uniref:DUF6896 domain-containing protein n=1 Tax=Nannocystis sp. ILAH1 TaxID=2996789 RepID=UPI0022715D4C|nr:hypothetical protein [Nannocystis sp. ILAH1]MCY0991966.1 hypothetical protein [Nannocystis sp. ILAH1]